MSDHNCFQNSIVIDSRKLNYVDGIRRRRVCSICNERLTTREVVVDTMLTENEQTEHKALLLKLTTQFGAKLGKFIEEIQNL